MRKIIVRLACVALASIICSAATAETYWAPPDIPGSLGSHPTHQGAPLIAQLTVGQTPIVLEKDYLSGVQMRLGGTPGGHGEAGGSVRWLCYYNTASSVPWILWIEALSDLHGSEVSAFQWQRVPHDARFDGRCQSLADSVTLPVPLTLGDSGARARAVLGAPRTEDPGTLSYDRVRSFQISGNSCGTVSGVVVGVRRKRVESILASQATAC
jgi:hypothetical protein